MASIISSVSALVVGVSFLQGVLGQALVNWVNPPTTATQGQVTQLQWTPADQAVTIGLYNGVGGTEPDDDTIVTVLSGSVTGGTYDWTPTQTGSFVLHIALLGDDDNEIVSPAVTVNAASIDPNSNGNNNGNSQSSNTGNNPGSGNNQSSGGLSNATKIGLGVGLGLGIPILAALAILFFLRRRRRARKAKEIPSHKFDETLAKDPALPSTETRDLPAGVYPGGVGAGGATYPTNGVYAKEAGLMPEAPDSSISASAAPPYSPGGVAPVELSTEGATRELDPGWDGVPVTGGTLTAQDDVRRVQRKSIASEIDGSEVGESTLAPSREVSSASRP